MQFIHSLVNAIATPMRALLYWFSRLVPGLRSIVQWSLPAKWSLLSLVFLMMIWAAAFVKHMLDSDQADRNWLFWFLFPIPFVIVIPVLIFFIVKYMLMKEVSRFPELDRIWTEGISESSSKGIDIAETPLFVVLGSSSQREVKTLLKLMNFDFAVDVPNSGAPPISFHAFNDGIFVFLNGCSCISRLSNAPSAATSTPNSPPEQGMLPTDVGGTIDASQLGAFNFSKRSEEPSPQYAPEMNVPGGTMLLDENQDMSEIWKVVASPRVLSSNDILECEDRLRHVCMLINKSRRPVCPINGIVTTLPFELIETSSAQLQIAIQKDTQILRQELQIRCPNTALVTGMEIEEGFVEMIKRLPPQQCSDNRFGKGSELWVAPESNRLDAIAVHATATFEDWIYTLFQESNALKKKHNSRLFMMLCRVRGVFADNLRSVIARGFGFDSQIEPELAYEQFLFGGCYFAATGSAPSHQAFVKSVFAKVLQDEGKLEWAPTALQQDRNYSFLGNLAALIGTIAVLAIVAMLIVNFLVMPQGKP